MRLRDIVRDERIPYGLALTAGYLIPFVVYVLVRL